MLTIVTKNGEYNWHIGDKAKPVSLNKLSEVELIQADGHELDRIRDIFSKRHIIGDAVTKTYTIPMPIKDVVVWYGDIARTIIANI